MLICRFIRTGLYCRSICEKCLASFFKTFALFRINVLCYLVEVN